ncbi:MAG: V-type ATPase subunit [Spirochaetaceae bacterium]|jgi:vacuolar-type H+-ATPase subunit C/Vma6|nr:V-type ATPase subunit [Spirochaetaceae bacterium]
MLRRGEQAYGYAKACGIIGKSFVGKRIFDLNGVSRLSDLDRLIFPQSAGNLPEKELLVDMEARIIQRSVKQILALVRDFIEPPDVLVQLIRSYEYEDMKRVLNTIAIGETKNPGFTDIGRFRRVAFEAYPDVEAMVRGTEFEGLLKGGRWSQQDTVDLQIKLDGLYYTGLWQDLKPLGRRERGTIERILGEEIALRNAVWVLRLRTYYNLSADRIREKLIRLGPPQCFAPAAAALILPLESYGPWSRWKYVSLLNPENPQQHWKVDPRYVQNAASEYLYRLVRLSFRHWPFAMDSIFCFIKLKQFEEDLLTSVAEGLGMGIPIQDVFTLLEVEP